MAFTPAGVYVSRRAGDADATDDRQFVAGAKAEDARRARGRPVSRRAEPGRQAMKKFLVGLLHILWFLSWLAFWICIFGFLRHLFPFNLGWIISFAGFGAVAWCFKELWKLCLRKLGVV